MKIDAPSSNLIPQLRTLWKEAFGDSDAFLDCFFAIAYAPERCRCVTEGSNVKAALYWFDVPFSGQKFAYLYAVATAADSRGKGFCRQLMADTAEVLRKSGYHGALLVPQDEKLRTMYGRMGYLPAAGIDAFFCTGSGSLKYAEITPEEYVLRRQALLPDGDASPEGPLLDFLSALVQFYAGDGFLAAVSRETDRLWIPEYLGRRDAVPALVAALGYESAAIRAPGDSIPFAMYLPLSPDCRKPDYYPFALD